MWIQICMLMLWCPSKFLHAYMTTLTHKHPQTHYWCTLPRKLNSTLLGCMSLHLPLKTCILNAVKIIYDSGFIFMILVCSVCEVVWEYVCITPTNGGNQATLFCRIYFQEAEAKVFLFDLILSYEKGSGRPRHTCYTELHESVVLSRKELILRIIMYK